MTAVILFSTIYYVRETQPPTSRELAWWRPFDIVLYFAAARGVPAQRAHERRVFDTLIYLARRLAGQGATMPIILS